MTTSDISRTPESPAEALPPGLEELRAGHHVRVVEGDEEGCAVTDLPAGVYGFAYAPGQDEVPVFAKKEYHSFEFHKASNGEEYVIGFVTPDEAAKLAASEEGASISLFPDPHGQSQVLASVPATQIVAPKKLLVREDGNPFHFKIA